MSQSATWMPGLSDYGIYIHIPFCQARCTYCDFNTITSMSENEHPAYVDALLAEWGQTEVPDGNLVSIFLGGGTPSLLDPLLVAKILRAIERRVPIEQETEITLETNPGTVTPARLAGYRNAGINRLSIGAQALQTHHLKDLNRIHDVPEIEQTVRWARAEGFDNLSLDAIYGLPGQTLEEWNETVEGLLGLDPDHLSLYQLQVEPGTPLADGVRKGRLHVPSDDLTADMALWAEDRLQTKDWQRYEISNFCRRQMASRHNTLYWTLNPYVGLGAGAHSYARHKRWWNVRGVRQYMQGSMSGQGTMADEEGLSLAEEIREYVWLGLRMMEGVDEGRFQQRFGRSLSQSLDQMLPTLEALGLIGWHGSQLALTQRGREMANVVARHLVDAEVSLLDTSN